MLQHAGQTHGSISIPHPMWRTDGACFRGRRNHFSPHVVSHPHAGGGGAAATAATLRRCSPEVQKALPLRLRQRARHGERRRALHDALQLRAREALRFKSTPDQTLAWLRVPLWVWHVRKRGRHPLRFVVTWRVRKREVRAERSCSNRKASKTHVAILAWPMPPLQLLSLPYRRTTALSSAGRAYTAKEQWKAHLSDLSHLGQIHRVIQKALLRHPPGMNA